MPRFKKLYLLLALAGLLCLALSFVSSEHMLDIHLHGIRPRYTNAYMLYFIGSAVIPAGECNECRSLHLSGRA
jgi:hypothetical protein